jgi:cytochrome c
MNCKYALASLALSMTLLATTSPAVGAVDEDAAKALLKSNDCFKCHAVDKTKKGPSYKKIAAKYKGKADAEQKLLDNVTKEPKVKLEDGTEEKHKMIDTKDAKELKNLFEFILSR